MTEKLRVSDLLENNELLEVGRNAVEDVLIDFRDSGLSQPLLGNGLVVQDQDGSDSSVIRLGMEDALRIALEAILKKTEE